MKTERKRFTKLPDQPAAEQGNTVANGGPVAEMPVPGRKTDFKKAKGGGPVTVQAKEYTGIAPQKDVGYGGETKKLVPNGYKIYERRPEWDPFMEPDPKAFHGPYKSSGESTPGDLPYLDGVEMTVPRMSVFEEVGLTNLEKLNLPKPFAQTVEITRHDGTKASINMVTAEDHSISIEDAHLVSEALLKQQVFEVNSDIAAYWGFKVEPGQKTTTVTGVQALAAVDKLVAEAVRLGDEGKAMPVPRHSEASRAEYLRVLRQFAINNLWHSATLTVTHKAAGFDTSNGSTLNETLNHDLVEPVPLNDLAWQLMKFRHAPWMDAWLRDELDKQAPGISEGLTNEQLYATLVAGHEEFKAKLRGEDDATNEAMAKMEHLASIDPVVQAARAKLAAKLAGKELIYNPNAANPHYLVAMSEWGGSREDSNTLCHPHRDAEHHDGTSKNPINLQKRFANGAVHHAGVELPPNVRNEDFMGWDDQVEGDYGRVIKEVFLKDGAFKNPIIQKGSFEMMKFERAMMQAGYMLPSNKVARPQHATYVDLNHAYQELQEVNKDADNRLWALQPKVEAALPNARPEVAAAARNVLAAMEQLEDPNASPESAARAASDAFNAFMKTTPDKNLVADLGQALQMRLIQQSALTVERTRIYGAVAEDLRTTLEALVPERKTLKLVPPDLMLDMRMKLEGLDAAIARAEEAGDITMSEYYQTWKRHVDSGFSSTEH